eukprot:SAG31_NODE_19690_length_594_cov_1.137374_1_plen_99_part_10
MLRCLLHRFLRNTLLLAGGGFYDHVIPPYKGVPGDESPCHVHPGCSAQPFDFRRLGIRVAGMLLSPWIPANTTIRRPTGPTSTSQYDLTSGIATAKKLF